MPNVSLEGNPKVFKLNSNETIYDALEKQGHQLAHGCLAGSCGACRIEVLTGKEYLLKMSMTEENTVESICDNYLKKNGPESLNNRTIRLSCRAKGQNIEGEIQIKPFR